MICNTSEVLPFSIRTWPQKCSFGWMSTHFHRHVPKSCETWVLLGSMVLELDVQQAHIGMMVRCPHVFDHIVYFIPYWNPFAILLPWSLLHGLLRKSILIKTTVNGRVNESWRCRLHFCSLLPKLFFSIQASLDFSCLLVIGMAHSPVPVSKYQSQLREHYYTSCWVNNSVFIRFCKH